MNSEELYFVKVYPSIGPAYYIGIPESVEDVKAFIEDHCKDVEFWEAAAQ